MAFSCSFEEAVRRAKSELQNLDFDKLKRSAVYRDPLDYYLLATYPPIKAMSPMSPKEVYSDASGLYRIYVHIPFCEQYCTFCHYTKEIHPKSDRVDRYLKALFREFELLFETFQGRIPAYSIFFGGGTPSYLTAPQLEKLFASLYSILDLKNKDEIIFELHPGVVRQPDYEDRIRMLRQCGVTRWVSGVQSMDEKVLQKLNRGHGRQEVFRFLEILRSNGCSDISLDLIYGLPYQTLENWYASIRDLVEAGVEKFNIFPLMFKAGDPIYKSYLREPQIFPGREERLLMHFLGEAVLEEEGFCKGPILYYSKGKHQYRALDESQSQPHERIEGLGLVAMGVSGFGYVNHVQYFNDCDMESYFASIEQGRLPVWLGHRLSSDERKRRAIMFGLRSRGVLKSDYEARFGTDPLLEFADEFNRLDGLGLLRVHDGLIRLSRLGEIDASGVAAVFCSPAVRDRVADANSRILNPGRDLLEIHDFSPIGHRGVSGQSGDDLKAPGTA